MRLLIKQRVFSWTDTYDVFDENENPKYFVKSEFFSLGHNIHIYNAAGNVEVGAVHQKLFSFLPQFVIEINGSTVGTIQKKFSFFKPSYQIDCNNWRVEGDFFGWNYEIMSAYAPIMQIFKEPFHWGDTYVLNFQNPEDELMGLLLVIAIDAVNCSKNR